MSVMPLRFTMQLRDMVERPLLKERPRPTIFDIAAYFEPSAHFKFSRRVRKEFDALSRDYARSTLLLGRYGGRPAMHTDIQGIGVATRVELGRLSILPGRQGSLFESAFEMILACQENGVVSGPLERIVLTFTKADQRPNQREQIRAAFSSVFSEGNCYFQSHEPHMLELGHCVTYQSLSQHMREDGLYHSAHRGRLEQVQRHLHQEVGRYENHRFFVSPRSVDGDVPELIFCYTGDAADRRVEAFVEGYTGELIQFVPAEEMHVSGHLYVGLKDYERASRRYGGLWILQGDIVSHLSAQYLGALHLFFDANLRPEDEVLDWNELFSRMRASVNVARAARTSPTFLEMALEVLAKRQFISVDSGGGFRLNPAVEEFQHASFYQLGEFRKRGNVGGH